ncbi:MAG: tetratricopeptide repeat protein [Sphingomonadales bacterium]|nr:tetratricopeptide repeat protein [Sphingomonadales bacterium]
MNPLTPPVVAQIVQAMAQLAVGQHDAGQALTLCQQAMHQGRAANAIPLLERLHALHPDQPAVARLLGYALRAEQRYAQADTIFSAAVTRAPRDVALRFGQAQTRYELGLPAARLFAKALELAPGDAEIQRNHALALISEGDANSAERLLLRALGKTPGWLDGHKALATLRWIHGDRAHFADSFAAATRAEPLNADLWTAWFRLLAQARDWPAALAVLDAAERQLGTTPAIMVSRLFVAVESHDDARAAELLDQTAGIRGDVTSLCRIRHALRRGTPEAVEAEALPLTAGPSAMLYWPYLSLAWRLLGDARWEWLDRPEVLVQPRESGMDAGDLAELAGVLRGLHTAAAPYIEQSVRGGTQTDRSVLLRHELALQRLKTCLLDTVRGYVDSLPSYEEGHPLLSAPRHHLLVEGSWSVRLLSQGYNVPHTHAMGWLSTAFYVALPKASDMGPPPAGHIAFGTPPAELGLDLAPTRTIQPAPGRMAIFPSTTWHGTVPFDDGERLVVAFDVRRPGY